MTTGYNREQLAELGRKIDEKTPPEITPADFATAPKVVDMSMAGMDVGMLLRLSFNSGPARDLFINCAVMLELIVGIHHAGQTQGWWLNGNAEPLRYSLETPVPEDLPYAKNVMSLRTSSEQGGVLIAFADPAEVFRFHMDQKAIAYLLAGAMQANDLAGWFDDDFTLIPNDGSKLQ